MNRTKLKRLQETSLAEAEVSERASAESASVVCSQTLLLALLRYFTHELEATSYLSRPTRRG